MSESKHMWKGPSRPLHLRRLSPASGGVEDHLGELGQILLVALGRVEKRNLTSTEGNTEPDPSGEGNPLM